MEAVHGGRAALPAESSVGLLAAEASTTSASVLLQGGLPMQMSSNSLWCEGSEAVVGVAVMAGSGSGSASTQLPPLISKASTSSLHHQPGPAQHSMGRGKRSSYLGPQVKRKEHYLAVRH